MRNLVINTAHKSCVRVALATAFILLLPLLAMQFSDEVVWDLADFAVAGALLIGAGLTYELAARMTGNIAYRAAIGVAITAALILVWVTLAVGIIGDAGNDANMLYFGVLAVGIIGAFSVRFQPRGMARTLFATAAAQVLVAVIALIADWGASGPIWPWDILLATGFFATLWIGSAWLFWHAAHGGSHRAPI